MNQVALLNVMETGILSETKLKGKTRQKKMILWIFATSNEISNLSKPLRSRFMELHLNEYTFDEIMEITRRLLAKKFNLNRNKMQSKDTRDVLQVAGWIFLNLRRKLTFKLQLMN